MDDELVARAARGDADAFDALARDRIDRLFAIASRILRDHHDAEDAVQHALWTAWSDLPGLRDPARFDAWLYRLLIRACYRAGHSRRRRAAIVSIVPEMDELPGTAVADAIVDRDALERAFASLIDRASGGGGPPPLSRARARRDRRDRRRSAWDGPIAAPLRPAEAPVGHRGRRTIDRRGRGVRTMNENHRNDDIVRAWVRSGPEQASADLVERTLRPVPRMRQRRSWRIAPASGCQGRSWPVRGRSLSSRSSSSASAPSSGCEESAGPSRLRARTRRNRRSSSRSAAVRAPGRTPRIRRRASTSAPMRPTARGAISMRAAIRSSTSTSSSALWPDKRTGHRTSRSSSTPGRDTCASTRHPARRRRQGPEHGDHRRLNHGRSDDVRDHRDHAKHG